MSSYGNHISNGLNCFINGASSVSKLQIREYNEECNENDMANDIDLRHITLESKICTQKARSHDNIKSAQNRRMRVSNFENSLERIVQQNTNRIKMDMSIPVIKIVQESPVDGVLVEVDESYDFNHLNEREFMNGYSKKRRIETFFTMKGLVAFCSFNTIKDYFLLNQQKAFGDNKWIEKSLMQVVNSSVPKWRTNLGIESVIQTIWSINHLLYQREDMIPQIIEYFDDQNLFNFCQAVLDLKSGPSNLFEERHREIYRFYIENDSLNQIKLSDHILESILQSRATSNRTTFDSAFGEILERLTNNYSEILNNLKENATVLLKVEKNTHRKKNISLNNLRKLNDSNSFDNAASVFNQIKQSFFNKLKIEPNKKSASFSHQL